MRNFRDLPYFAALGIIVWLGFFPGIMNADSTDMLKQAVTGAYNEWHSPFLSFVWGLANNLIFGPASLTLVCNALFFAAAYLFLHRLFVSPWHRMLAVTAVAAWPPIANALGSATKDDAYVTVMMVVALCLATATTSPTPGPRRLWPWMALGLSCLVAELIRHDAVAALIPLIAAACFPALPFRQPGWRLTSSIALAVACGAALYVSAVAVNRVVFHAVASDPLQPTIVFDLAGISLCAGENLMPRYVIEQHAVELATLSDRYRSYGSMPLVWPPGQTPLVSVTPRRADIDALNAAWLGAVAGHPLCYVRHRAGLFAAALGLIEPPAGWQYQFISDNNPNGYFPSAAAMGADFPPAPLSRAYDRVAPHLARLGVFSGWTCLVGALVLAGWGMRLARRGVARGAAAIAFAASALLPQLSLAVVASDAMTRYLYWPILAVFLGVFVALGTPSTTADPGPGRAR